jgi:thioredoxin-related protein
MRPSVWFAVCGLLASLASTPVAADAPPPPTVSWQTDADRAWSAACEQGRPLLLLFVSGNCGYCVKMKYESFGDPRVVADVQSTFVPAIIKSDAKHAELMKTLGIRSFPTAVVVSPDARIVGRVTGYVGPQELRRHLAAAAHRLAVRPDAKPGP